MDLYYFLLLLCQAHRNLRKEAQKRLNFQTESSSDASFLPTTFYQRRDVTFRKNWNRTKSVLLHVKAFWHNTKHFNQSPSLSRFGSCNCWSKCQWNFAIIAGSQKMQQSTSLVQIIHEMEDALKSLFWIFADSLHDCKKQKHSSSNFTVWKSDWYPRGIEQCFLNQ